jgi:hypothetical protein
MQVFCSVALCGYVTVSRHLKEFIVFIFGVMIHFNPEDEGGKSVRNVEKKLPNHTAQYPIRLDSQQPFCGSKIVVKIILISDYFLFYISCVLLLQD